MKRFPVNTVLIGFVLLHSIAIAQEAQSHDYFSYPLGYETGPLSAVFLQGYLGYRTRIRSATFLVKAGRLMPAFGHYALEYDDAKSPLIDPPSIYSVSLPLRSDQIPCNLQDILHQSYDDSIQFGCAGSQVGGSTAERYGLTPVTLYGIPGIEAELSWGRIDGRIQMTNSSPANPQSLLSHSQFVQWTAGGGYTLPGGIHVGASGFRGPYLSGIVEPVIENNFSASGMGIDAQWFGGPWSVEGEWQHFHFGIPGFAQSPALNGGYFQVKRILTPRLYAAARTNWQLPGAATDSQGMHADQISAHQETEEVVLGYRINRLQLLKTGFTFSDRPPWNVGSFTWEGERHYGLELQLVTSFTDFAWAFH